MELQALETIGFQSGPGIFASDDGGDTDDTSDPKTDKEIPSDDDE